MIYVLSNNRVWSGALMKRVAFGIVWFLVFWLGAGMVGGGIAGVLAQVHNSPSTAAAQPFPRDIHEVTMWVKLPGENLGADTER